MASVSKRTWTYKGAEKTAWIVRYKDSAGRHRQQTFPRKKDADAAAYEVETRQKAGGLLAKEARLPIRRIALEYMGLVEAKERDGRIGINRRRSLSSCFRISIVPHIGDLIMDDLTPARVEQLYQDLQAKDGLAVRTAKDRIYNLQLLEQFAIKRGYATKAPVTQALKDLRGTRPSRVRTFNADEVAHLLRVVSARGHNFKARSAAMIECMVNVAAFCGLRYGEIMALSVECIDLERRMIKVRQSLLFNDTLKGPKTAAGVRDIPMPQRVIDLLSAWLTRWYVRNDRGLLFRTPKGTIVSQANFHRQWTYLMARAGLDNGERFHFHALRHFCASWMIENGLPVTDVAALLGHSKFDMTLQVYAHPVVRPSLRHDAIDRMVAAMPADAPNLCDANSAHGENSRLITNLAA